MNAPMTQGDVRHQILEHLLAIHATWLQAAPRTTLAVLVHLDLPVACHSRADRSWVDRIGSALWDAGYTPYLGEDNNPSWCWWECENHLGSDRNEAFSALPPGLPETRQVQQ